MSSSSMKNPSIFNGDHKNHKNATDIVYKSMSKQFSKEQKQKWAEEDSRVRYKQIKKPETMQEYLKNKEFLDNRTNATNNIKQHLYEVDRRERIASRPRAKTNDDAQRMTDVEMTNLKIKVGYESEEIYKKLREIN